MAAALSSMPSTSGRLGAGQCKSEAALYKRPLPRHGRLLSSAGTRGVQTRASLPGFETLYGSCASAATREQLAAALSNLPAEPLLLEFPNPLSALQFHAPAYFPFIQFLLGQPLITFGLAVFLYIAVPRIWRAFIRFVVTPAVVLFVGYIVIQNPNALSNAGSFVTNFTHDHPYATSATIMIGLTLILSPYLLTVLLALVLAVGIPRLPAPLRRMLPAPIVEMERQVASINDATRGPVESIKSQAFKFGSTLKDLLQKQTPSLK